MIPKNPVILLSFVNTLLRDHYSSLEELCADRDLEKDMLICTLEQIDYIYDEKANQFV